ncbi:hypothetical protein [[Phormidium] sp. ETS-05]|uniref:hypothetical protein n=1 Tax=[Phormidium] sp. ETS-05 TaxID=222819 RepID=UPI0018EF244F|nr:hypothetical protein [[Phormidium] sp. ETS-05]
MIIKLVNSAFQTGCLSVESEGLMRQMVALKAYKSTDIEALTKLRAAVNAGAIQRETKAQIDMQLPIIA